MKKTEKSRLTDEQQAALLKISSFSIEDRIREAAGPVPENLKDLIAGLSRQTAVAFLALKKRLPEVSDDALLGQAGFIVGGLQKNVRENGRWSGKK